MKPLKFSLVLRTRENTNVFITLDDNIYGILSKRVSILYIIFCTFMLYMLTDRKMRRTMTTTKPTQNNGWKR